MNGLMENRMLRIHVAQLTDELSGVNKELRDTREELKQYQSNIATEIHNMKQEYESRLTSLREQHRMELERHDAATKEAVDCMKEDHRRRLMQKDLEIQRLHECNADLVVSCGKSLAAVNAKCDSMGTSLTKSISQNQWLRQHHWGKSTEQARLLQNRNPLTRREEKELFMQGIAPSGLPVDTAELITARRRKTESPKRLRLDYGKHKPYTSNPVYIKLDDYFVLSGGERFKHRNGVVETRVKHVVKMIPAHFEEYFIEVATVRSNGEERDTFEVEDQIIPGVPFDKEMISFVLTEHYSFNTTWANIARKLEYYGVHVSDSTLGNIAHRCISYIKRAMAQVWEEELYKTNYWMLDETTVLVAETDEKTGVRKYRTKYLWGIRANKLRLSWFIYDKGSRGRRVIKPYLDRFKGCFTTDGYIVYKLYDQLKDADQIRCACLTHIRRLFVDALHENRGLMSWFINRIKELFVIEAECKERKILGGSERLHERTCRSSVIMQQIENKFKFYINSASFHKLGTMTQAALRYINNEWEAMKNVLKFGDAEISNNLCEQMMRHVKTNLKNSQNIGSEECAGNFCFMYSLVESCGFNALSPFRYISYLLQSLRFANTPAERRHLLPCYCKL